MLIGLAFLAVVTPLPHLLGVGALPTAWSGWVWAIALAVAAWIAFLWHSYGGGRRSPRWFFPLGDFYCVWRRACSPAWWYWIPEEANQRWAPFPDVACSSRLGQYIWTVYD